MSVFLIPKIYCLYVKNVEKKKKKGLCNTMVFFFVYGQCIIVLSLFSFSPGNTKGQHTIFSPQGNFFFPVYCSLWQKMSSRRATSSSFGNGRSSNGDDISGSSRPSSCSYLSNVRPENRYRISTNPVCSVTCQNVSVWDLVNQIHAL